MGHDLKLELKALSVQSTTLDDVFLHFTGHGLTEMPETAPAGRPRQGRPFMKRALALVERDMRKFRRSPALIFASLVLPLVQLVILGNAFGGNIKNVNVGRGQPRSRTRNRWASWSGSGQWAPMRAPSSPAITTIRARLSATSAKAC
ncbi:MAG: hypothetical protein WDO73_07505 [Ignavibacteriota bacterium]